MVNDLHCIFGSLLREVKIEHGGFQAAVAHESLNNFRMDPGLEKMGSIAMAKRMDGDSPFVDARLVLGLPEGPLDTVDGHGVFGRWSLVVSSAEGWENEIWVPMGYPITAKQLIGLMAEALR
jgi:hypothetical protein